MKASIHLGYNDSDNVRLTEMAAEGRTPIYVDFHDGEGEVTVFLSERHARELRDKLDTYLTGIDVTPETVSSSVLACDHCGRPVEVSPRRRYWHSSINGRGCYYMCATVDKTQSDQYVARVNGSQIPPVSSPVEATDPSDDESSNPVCDNCGKSVHVCVKDELATNYYVGDWIHDDGMFGCTMFGTEVAEVNDSETALA